MILVKLLIWLFLILLGFYLYDHLHLLSYFDGREGFQQQQAKKKTDDDDISETVINASNSMANETIELKFSEKSPLEQHKGLANDAEMMSELQEKINELLNLKDQAVDINNNMKI